MTAPRAGARRGQPLVVLAVVLAGWSGLRFAVLSGDDSPALVSTPRTVPVLAETSVAPLATPGIAPPPADVQPRARLPRSGERPGAIMPALPDPAAPTIAPPPLLAPVLQGSPARIAAGHQLLYAAALAQLPLPALLQAARPPLAAPAPVAPLARRWSGDAWTLVRRGGNGFNLPGAGLPGANLPSGVYGASQAGAVIRYRLAPASRHKPELYVRATSALHAPRGEELAAGLALRPLAGVPLAALVEGRATRTLTGSVVRPAAAVVSELPAARLPFGLRAEAYVQAGYVGGRDATAFADGQGRIERRLVGAGRWQLRAGAGAWGGAQKGASRIDAGPTATLDLPLGPVSGRLAADWRFRVGGGAAPTSGPALTLSAGF
ncbi:hypothetical protein B0I00_1708 [Novosphingobium kunmingense]|uniref:Uncharacterized protein n=1 Tax=Novosphingobium kunmingense TaxID=1211806 RepID=A0A2N0HKK9_9SPHN|nr:hypothetical protein [Novosphingobium kunmingense]PKB19472.1 hypothetical protein B0I00_1708 [Novosphingobium kunmingense]